MKSSGGDSLYWTHLAARCFNGAQQSGASTIAVGLRELGRNYLELAKKDAKTSNPLAEDEFVHAPKGTLTK